MWALDERYGATQIADCNDLLSLLWGYGFLEL